MSEQIPVLHEFAAKTMLKIVCTPRGRDIRYCLNLKEIYSVPLSLDTGMRRPLMECVID